jgi:hypothetical protein
MRTSFFMVFGSLGLGFSSLLLAAGPVSSDLPKKSTAPPPQVMQGGAMASGFASGSSSASSNGNGGQTTSKAQVQLGGVPQFGNNPKGTVSSDLPALPGFPANLLPINAEQFGNPALANPAGGNQRASATINSGEDKITTGADDQYSTVIKVKPNGQITMIVVTLATMEIRRVQVKNVEELQKKDKLAYTEFQKYTEAE